MKSDAELVAAVLRGDKTSFEALVRRYERAVMATTLSVLADFHAAQDAAQDAFVVAFRKLGTLRNGSRFAPWILRTARRRAVELARQRARRERDTVSQSVDDLASCGSLNRAAREVLAAVDGLPERERQAILLHYCDGLSVRETAQSMGVAVGTVTKCLSRAYARLRRILSEEREP